MKGKSIELLKTSLTSGELCILDMYELINRKFIQKNYKAEGEILEVLIKYFKSKNLKELSTIWEENFLQRIIFLFCVEVWKFYEKNHKLEEKDLENILKNNIENSFLKKALLKMYSEISKLCIHSERDSLKNIYFYEDDIFKITNINNNTFSKVKKYFSVDEIFFYVITKGIVTIGKTVLFKNDGYCTEKEPILDKIEGITNDYSMIILGVKKDFIKKLNIKLVDDYDKKFTIYSLEIFSLILKDKEITKDNYFRLYQIVTYMSQLAKGNKIELFKIPYLEYKSKIIKIIEENILLEEREVIEKICETIKVSLPTLYKIFKSLFNESPTKYIERRKMNYTCFYLCNTNESIEKIGENVGYSRRLYSKKFLEFSGYMPTDFRRMMR